MKKCTKCKNEKDINEFNRKASGKGGRSSHCRLCSRAYVKKHFQKNKEYYRAKQRARNIMLFSEYNIIVEELKSKPCVDCNDIFDPCAMDFDHVRGAKVGNISAMIRGGVSKEVLLKELEKCEVVCSNCHRVRTKNRGYNMQS